MWSVMPSVLSSARNLLSAVSAWAVETAPSGASKARHTEATNRKRFTMFASSLPSETPTIAGRNGAAANLLGGWSARDHRAGHDGGLEPIAPTHARAARRTAGANGHTAQHVSGPTLAPGDGLTDRLHGWAHQWRCRGRSRERGRNCQTPDVGSGAQTGRHLAAGTGTGAERAADPRGFRDGRRGRRCGGGENSRRFGHLNAEVAHTNAEVRQTFGVVEEARVVVVAGEEGSQI